MDPSEARADEVERVARYLHLLDILPLEVIEKAHTFVFERLASYKRTQLRRELAPFVRDGEAGATDDPAQLSLLMSRWCARTREPRLDNEADGDGLQDGCRPILALLMMGAGPALTYFFMSSPALSAYFGPVPRVVGDGMDVERQWIHNPGSPPERAGYAISRHEWREGRAGGTQGNAAGYWAAGGGFDDDGGGFDGGWDFG